MVCCSLLDASLRWPQPRSVWAARQGSVSASVRPGRPGVCAYGAGPYSDAAEHRKQGNHVNTTEPTVDERRLAESYRGVLADVARCAQALRDGDWSQLAVVA